MKENTLIIYTDGAYSPIKRKGGWAFYLPQYRLRVCKGDDSQGITNNRMEMMAVIKALELVINCQFIQSNIIIYTDSQYVIQTILGNYHRNYNLDLWNIIDQEIKILSNKNITWQHVKGHNGTIENEVVDKFANLVSQMK